MSYKIAKIQISGLPAIFPTNDYREVFYTENRVTRNGSFFDTIESDRKLKTVNDSFEAFKIIQNGIYDAYKVVVYSTESRKTELIQAAEYMNVFLVEEDSAQFVTTHIGIVESIETERADDTELLKHTIYYHDINYDNYLDGKNPVNDYFKSDKLLSQGFTKTQLVRLRLFDNSSKVADPRYLNYFSKIIPVRQLINVVEQATELNGIVEVSKATGQQAYVCEFYMSENDVGTLLDNTRIGNVKIENDNVQLFYNSVKYDAVERLTPESERLANAVDLYKVTINFKYQNNVETPFN